MSNKATTYLTIMSKNSMFSFLGLVGVEMIDTEDEVKPVIAVIKLDPREGQPIMREYPTRGEAIRQYHEAITTSIARGWQVIYRGCPMWG
ncbi:MAG: hypothetical protein ACK562_07335 [Acidobacteriota bacterium]